MNLDPLTLGLLKINYLVVNLNRKNFKQTNQDLLQLISNYGLEAENHTLRCLLTEAAKTAWDSDRSSTVAINSIHATLLAQHLTSVLNHPAKSTVVCRTIDNPTRFVLKILKTTNTLLNKLSRLLKLTTVEDVAFSLSLKKHSSKPEIVALAKAHLKKRFLDLVQCYLDAERGHQVERAGLQDCSPEVLQTLLTNLAEDGFGLANVTKELFLDRLRSDFPREVVPIVLAPLLYKDDTRTPLKETTTVNDMATAMIHTSLPEFLHDIGYAFTSSVEDCKNHMLNFGTGEPTSSDIARILTVMVNYHNIAREGPVIQTPGNFWTKPDVKKNPSTHRNHDHWNLEIFVQALSELAPKLNWKEVMLQLDHPEFNVSDREGLTILITSLKLGLQKASYPPEMFPANYFCGRWTNLIGQMSLITHILRNSDVFSFGDHLYLPVSIDLLKSPPEIDNKDISTWRNICLVEFLLYAADHGYYSQVHELFKFPLQHCPDILALVLLQIDPPITMMRQELLTLLTVTFLGNQPNSTVILHLTWDSHHSTTKSIMMHAMAEWYLRGDHDQTKLARILDIAQDLKSLSLLLNISEFPFVIDLACLASRRDYLKLEKWLTDKIRDHGETFITALVKFLQRRCPGVVGKVPEEPRFKITNLPRETVITMVACLQPCITNVQPELQEAICNLISNCQTFLSNKRPVTALARSHSKLLDTQLNPALGGQVMTAQPGFSDSITSLTANTVNLNLAATSSTSFAMPSTLGPLVNPGSPSRIMGAGLSPFAMMPMMHNPNINLNALTRMAPISLTELPEQLQYPEMMHSVTREVEDEVNGYFQRIYNHPPHPTLSVDEVLEMIQKFKNSPNKREREVFSCMLRNLFEEYKFFPQYPDKELYITAQLFGGIIQKGLVPSYVSFGLALRFVLDALKKPEGSKMYYFGIAALDRFKSRLKEYQKYCEHIRGIPHFGDFPPHLIEYIEYGLQSQEPPTKPQGAVLPISLANVLHQNTLTVPPFRSVPPPPLPLTKVTNAASSLGSRPSIANATNIDTLLTATDNEEKMNSPPEPIQDKTAFIFNNLSQLNLQMKCDELKEIVTEEYYPWLAQYLVMKRASIEHNFHTLYSNFLDVLKVKLINKMVTKETYRNIKVLLRSDKGIANFSDRSLLKNLGHWLGMITLARSLPILHLDIDLKGLVLEAYYKGPQELLYVVPFVAKILHACSKSEVFKPPNPWTMALMNVLAELHQEPDLKLNLKFEIEVLCKNLSLDVVNLKPTVYLKDPEKLKHIDFHLSELKVNMEGTSTMLVNQPLVPSTQLQVAGAFQPQAPLMQPEEFGVTESNTILQSEPNFMCGIALPEPRFNYAEVNVTSTSGFSQKICVNPHILLLQTFPKLKEFVKTAVERSIQEWIHPVVDRSIKYALTTCEQIIRKDFALDPDECRMRSCAHHMMRNLTAAVAMITCREQIITTIQTNLKASFNNALRPLINQQDIIEKAAAVLAAENMELACSFIQKTAVEKALPELDKRLANDYELRRLSRLEGRRYYDPMVLKVLREKIDERIRQTLGELNPNQLSVYNEFACNIPGFTPVRDAGLFALNPQLQEQYIADPTMASTQVFATDDIMNFISNAEIFINSCGNINFMTPPAASMNILLECLLMAYENSNINSGTALLQRAVEGILEVRTFPPPNERHNIITYRDVHLSVLRYFTDPRVFGHWWTTKQITCYIVKSREELRYNFEGIDCLIRNHLVNLPQYDIALMQMMENGHNIKAIAFAMQLVQVYFIDDRSFLYVDEADLHHTTEMLFHIASHSRSAVPEGLGTLMATLRTYQDSSCLGEALPVGPTAHFHAGMMLVCERKNDDPPGLQERTQTILREWRNLELHVMGELVLTHNFTLYVNNMKLNGILKSDDLLLRFFRIASQICIHNVYILLSEDTLPSHLQSDREKFYVPCDSFTKLTTMVIKSAGNDSNAILKLNVLNKILGVMAGHIIQDTKERGSKFHQLPYHRMLIILFLDMTEPVLDSISLQIITAFCHTLHTVRPSLAPGFCYAWLEIVGHRAFLSKVMTLPQQKGWGMFNTLMIDLFKFLNPFLRNTEMPPPVQAMYNGMLKLLLVLLHDFPGFLCDYYYGFCDEIAPNCIQLRNLILSAFPSNMRLPDPFTPNLKVDLLAEIALPPRGYVNFSLLITSEQFKKDLETYLTTRVPATFPSEVKANLQIDNDPNCHYNVKLMNAVVLFIGTRAISHIRSNGLTPSKVTIAHTAHMDIFQTLMVDLDCEGRYLFLNAIANQLRYPNSHTHYFSCTVLYLFDEAPCEAVKEQITRTLLERLIANRPQPWGLLVTFIELIKNPVYKFWSYDFVHCAPEIEKLFTSVARSCMTSKSGVESEDKEMHE